jgi:putative ABC transport system permease protein
LSKEFLRLILVSFFLAIPVGWILMSQWPDDCDYAFRINIGWWVFGIAGAIALMIAIVIIVIQAMKAATTNPVTSLRSQ